MSLVLSLLHAFIWKHINWTIALIWKTFSLKHSIDLIQYQIQLILFWCTLKEINLSPYVHIFPFILPHPCLCSFYAITIDVLHNKKIYDALLCLVICNVFHGAHTSPIHSSTMSLLASFSFVCLVGFRKLDETWSLGVWLPETYAIALCEFSIAL